MLSIVIGIWAYLWCSQLTMQGQIFCFVRRWMKSIESESIRNPLIDCPKCHAGQLAFWWFLINDVDFLFIGVTISIFTAYLLEKYDV